METKANYTIVGLFTVMITVATFGFIYWYAELWQTGQFTRIIVHVPGSARGLNIGSPVRFNGISVGEVKSVAIDFQNPAYSRVEADILIDTPINSSSIVKLESQGLTGISLLEMSTPQGVGSERLRQAYQNGTSLEFKAQPSGVANLIRTAEKIMARTDNIVEQVENLVSTVQEPISNTLKNTETFSQVLTKNADGVDTFLKNVSSLTNTIQTLSMRIDKTLTSADSLLASVDSEKIDVTLTNFEQLSSDARQSLAKIDLLITEVKPDQIRNTMDNIVEASAEVKTAISDIAANSGGVGLMISDIRETARQLSAASKRIDNLLAEVEPGQVGKTFNNISQASSDARIALKEAQETLTAFKDITRDLNQRLDPIAKNIERFTGTGLRDIEALVNETRRSVSRMERSIHSIENNPQRLIFGGDSVKQFDGRTHR